MLHYCFLCLGVLVQRTDQLHHAMRTTPCSSYTIITDHGRSALSVTLCGCIAVCVCVCYFTDNKTCENNNGTVIINIVIVVTISNIIGC